jgi:hypothetical protein
LAADAVTEQAHDGDVEHEPQQIEQGRADAFRDLGGEGRFGRGRRDWRFPRGGCGGHVHGAFYTDGGRWARLIFVCTKIIWVAYADGVRRRWASRPAQGELGER